MQRTDYYLDTEFIDGKCLDLISIGIVSHDGRAYYAQSIEFSTSNVPDFVRDHVWSSLHYCPHSDNTQEHNQSILLSKLYHSSLNEHPGKCRLDNCPWRTRAQIRDEVEAFMNIETYGTPEFHMWCGSHDYYALCGLFGGMVNLPKGWPHAIRDLQNLLDDLHIDDADLPPLEGQAHHALTDAKYERYLFELLMK